MDIEPANCRALEVKSRRAWQSDSGDLLHEAALYRESVLRWPSFFPEMPNNPVT